MHTSSSRSFLQLSVRPSIAHAAFYLLFPAPPQAAQLLKDGNTKYVRGDRMAAMNLYEEALAQVSVCTRTHT